MKTESPEKAYSGQMGKPGTSAWLLKGFYNYHVGSITSNQKMSSLNLFTFLEKCSIAQIKFLSYEIEL